MIPGDLKAAAIVSLIGVVWVLLLIHDFKKGFYGYRYFIDKKISRNETPGLFWIITGIHIVGILGCFAAVIDILVR